MTSELGSLDVQVDGAELLDQVRAALCWWVKFPCLEAADATALYITATHAAPALQFAPRLRVKSPQKRCGKSRLLEVASHLVCNPLKTVSISAAALVRSIDPGSPPTIIFDEADAVFGKGLKGDEKAEHLRGILNAGFDRNQPYIRWDVTTRALENCPTFALAVIAGIGDLPDTIEDRAVPLVLARKTKEETCLRTGPHGQCPLVHKFRPRRDVPVLTALRGQVTAWAVPRAERIGAAEPVMPDGLNDRAEDVWEALIAVADMAGGTWPRRARTAAVKLMGEAETGGADRSLGLRLLADLRVVFKDVADDGFLATNSEVLMRLCKVDESPWRTVNKGAAIDDNRLASLLRPYGVRSGQKWEPPNTTTRGYFKAHLQDAWARYLTPDEPDQARGAARPARGASEPLTSGYPLAGQNDLARYPARYKSPQASDQGPSTLGPLAGTPSWAGQRGLISEQFSAQDAQSSLEPDYGELWLRADHSTGQHGDDDGDWQE